MADAMADAFSSEGAAGVHPEVAAITDVANEKELRKVDYTAQGDPDMSNPLNLQLRAANRDDPAVCAVLDAFWDAVMCEANPDLIPEDQDAEGQSSSAVLTREQVHVAARLHSATQAHSASIHACC